MIQIETIDVVGWEPAIIAMRNPLNSWHLSDSEHISGNFCEDYYEVGHDDLDLMRRLASAGVPHRTFGRMIQWYGNITAPLYWWKEMDRYRVGKEQISTSTMHTIHKTPLSIDNLSVEACTSMAAKRAIEFTINAFNIERDEYLLCVKRLKTATEMTESERRHWRNKMERAWKSMIQLLPSSYMQKRTVMLSYETLAKIREERYDHKLGEWRVMCGVIDHLPHFEDIYGRMKTNVDCD